MSWIAPDVLRHKRLDAPYYSAEHLEIEATILRASRHVSFDALGSFAQLWSGPFGSKLPSSLYRAAGPYPLYRSQNVKAFWIQRDGLVYLDTDAYYDLKSCSTEPGDILVSKAGFVGTACIVGKDEGPAIITEHVLGVRPKDDTDSYYLLATLNSTICRHQLEREGLGTILDYLGVEVSRELLVPRPKYPVQVAIGNKVRAAEYLWRQAQQLYSESSISLSNVLLSSKRHSPFSGIHKAEPYTSTIDASYSWTATSVSAFRFDPPYYHPQLVENHNWLRSYGGAELGELADSRDGIAGGSTPLGTNYSVKGIRFIRTQDYGPDGIEVDRCVFIDEHHDRKNARSRLQVGDVLLSITGEFVSAVVDEECLPANISQHTVRIRLKDTENTNPYWLSLFLNSQFGMMETQRYSYGLTRPAIDYQAVRSIFVPCPPPRIQHEIGEKTCTAQEHRRRMDRLMKNAISDVEALIEGELNESVCLEEGRKLADEFGFEMP